jgi:hypothetical protein
MRQRQGCVVSVNGQHGPRTQLTHDWAVPGRRGCTHKFLDVTAEDDAEEEIVYTVPDKIVFKVALPSAPLLLLKEEEEDKEQPHSDPPLALYAPEQRVVCTLETGYPNTPLLR